MKVIIIFVIIIFGDVPSEALAEKVEEMDLFRIIRDFNEDSIRRTMQAEWDKIWRWFASNPIDMVTYMAELKDIGRQNSVFLIENAQNNNYDRDLNSNIEILNNKLLSIFLKTVALMKNMNSRAHEVSVSTFKIVKAFANNKQNEIISEARKMAPMARFVAQIGKALQETYHQILDMSDNLEMGLSHTLSEYRKQNDSSKSEALYPPISILSKFAGSAYHLLAAIQIFELQTNLLFEKDFYKIIDILPNNICSVTKLLSKHLRNDLLNLNEKALHLEGFAHASELALSYVLVPFMLANNKIFASSGNKTEASPMTSIMKESRDLKYTIDYMFDSQRKFNEKKISDQKKMILDNFGRPVGCD